MHPAVVIVRGIVLQSIVLIVGGIVLISVV